MANINHKPSKYMLNLLHVLPVFVEEKEDVINTIVEINSGSINKYETITESGQLKLDRVGYSSLAYPFAYGAIPQTWDYDSDPLDVEIINVIEPLVPGCVVEARIIGVMKFKDGEEIDDKIVAVLSDDRRSDHIQSVEDLGEQFKKESTYFWEHIKYLKKPGTGVTKGFFNKNEAIKVVKECEQRYKDIYLKNFN
ncbi:inorganic pyrophosphatase [Candidatus Nomurabacteria bacterium RIFCSPHIGHO2_02_FULL_37_13]|uniref:inorganic diphosphatase n=1 Tax=Candidatus Nomurabacteria bacterium RIFCSPHIGHO2_02_FULL_37_13 TaxID=1801750 RepID=A0A1F6W4K6_9BACT|nr:MAG: inorganic pyrophosphatase [Candidatus Nomurabacteria bacterium RIFCSPHIGHO2_01_FULL_36_23]OGI76867.1 MAG: inorganic pyrophosphatase [Candidatus Nomurabacteria bacterium RIFCSPHIGHO2_02_FULL_37_13]OGI87838.1 MAG: inorganic pyrophosphatase [Candidatus Nomurabacteria bacterium RIFCSPLOWO2_01_FULL_37_25]